MAGSRKPPSAEPIAVALSGGVDSVVLLHVLRQNPRLRLSAVHVHHGLSPSADAWARFCRRLCRRLGVPLTVRKVKVRRAGAGLEAAARAARYAALAKARAGAIALAHNLDDQAETVLMSLLRGAGARGAAGMPGARRRAGKLWLRPLLGVPRAAIEAYARAHRLEWIDDESNADEALTRNFVRRRLGPLIGTRFPRWREALARAARHFARRDVASGELLRAYLGSQGLRAPSEAKLVEMLKQLGARGARTRLEHDGATLRVYRGKVWLERPAPAAQFAPLRWNGERCLPIPALGGELRFRRVRGRGIDAGRLEGAAVTVRLRAGGERLQPDPKRPRRTLKNLFQENGVPPWQRERLPLLYCGARLAWVPGLGADASLHPGPRAWGVLPEWHSVR